LTATGADPLDEEDSIGELFGRLVDDGRTVAAAEMQFYRQVFYRRVALARVAIGLAVLAAALVLASLIALFLGLVIWLMPWIGPVGSGLMVCLFGLVIAGLLVRAALRRLGPALAGQPSFSSPDAVREGATP